MQCCKEAPIARTAPRRRAPKRGETRARPRRAAYDPPQPHFETLPMIVAGDQQLLKQINRMALVRHLCGAPGLSRAALAEAVGLTKSTVSLLVRELLDEGWLSESELVATGALGRWRPVRFR